METDNTLKKIEEIHIALCVNDTWAQYVAPLVYSISVNNSDEKIVIHLVYRDISEEKLQTIQQLEEVLNNVQIDFQCLDNDALSDISVDGYHLPIETYFRLLLPELLPMVDRVIYLDVDTMVCGSLMELWTSDLRDSCIGAVLDLDVQTSLSWHLERIGYEKGEPYFNAGILLLDLQNMRNRQLSQMLQNKAREWKERLFYGDQDLLNFFFKDEVVYLPNHFNMGIARLHHYQEGDPLAIVHFNGPEKAWRPLWELSPTVRRFASSYQTIARRCQALLKSPQPLVSLVVFAQGGGGLPQCLSSLSSQTHFNLDILVLATELTEEKRQEVVEWQCCDERIRVINFKASDDIVALLRASVQGEYIGFVAADDFLEQGFVSDLLQVANQEQADLVISDYYSHNVDEGIFYFHSSNDGTIELLSSLDAVSRQREPLFAGLWGKFIRRDLLGRMPGTVYSELTLARQFYLLSKKLLFLKTTHFCHRLHCSELLPADKLRYFRGKLTELESLLTDYRLFNFETDWIVLQLEELLKQATEYLDDVTFSAYLEEKLKLINN